MGSVLQDWVMELPLREQSTLLTAVRGCDLAPKVRDTDGRVVNTTERHLTAYIRGSILTAADPREVGMPGSFMRVDAPRPFSASALGHYPLHWYTHTMHALEVIAYRHPDPYHREDALRLYLAMVENLHLRPERCSEMVERLSEDRIASGKAVS